MDVGSEDQLLQFCRAGPGDALSGTFILGLVRGQSGCVVICTRQILDNNN